MNTIKKIVRYIKPYWVLLLLSFLIVSISIYMMSYLPILFGKIIDTIIQDGVSDNSKVINLMIKVLIAILIIIATQYFGTILNQKISYLISKKMRIDAISILHRLKISEVDTMSHGDTLSRIMVDVEQFSEGFLQGTFQGTQAVLTVIMIFCFLLKIQPVVAMVVLVITPVSIFIAGYIAKKTHAMFQQQAILRSQQTALIDETISNQKTVLLFCQQDEIMKRFDQLNESLRKYSLFALFFSSLPNPSTRFINALVYTGVTVVGAFAAINQMITIGQFSAILSYVNQYTKPFNEITGTITEMQNAFACAERVFEFLEKDQFEEEDSEVFTSFEGEMLKEEGILMKQVSFGYEVGKPIIKNINIHVSKGQKVAIVGPTGCGKTTFINLLMRFYDVDSGEILMNGIPIKKLSHKLVRESYGMVLQDTWLKSASIIDNIKIAKPEATREEIIVAAKESHAHTFIKKLPQGYDTIIGENSETISVGEKQLLCITRIMLSLPPMLILDEATSSIDTRTEQMIQQNFSKMMKGRTCFIVAHRLSTIKEADLILVMNEGEIVEQGNHESLIEKKGFYYTLYKSQF